MKGSYAFSYYVCYNAGEKLGARDVMLCWRRAQRIEINLKNDARSMTVLFASHFLFSKAYKLEHGTVNTLPMIWRFCSASAIDSCLDGVMRLQRMFNMRVNRKPGNYD